MKKPLGLAQGLLLILVFGRLFHAISSTSTIFVIACTSAD